MQAVKSKKRKVSRPEEKSTRKLHSISMEYCVLLLLLLSTAHRTALSPEYQFNIHPQIQWSKTKGFKGGGLKVKTTTALSPDTSSDCGTNAVMTIAVLYAESDYRYRAIANVTLYDPNAGNILCEKKEERSFTAECGPAEFTVSLGSLKNTSSRKKDKLILQVKFIVHEEKIVS